MDSLNTQVIRLEDEIALPEAQLKAQKEQSTNADKMIRETSGALDQLASEQKPSRRSGLGVTLQARIFSPEGRRGQTVLNRIPGKSVHACDFAHECLQHHVSYVGIDMFSRTIMKTMYRTISN